MNFDAISPVAASSTTSSPRDRSASRRRAGATLAQPAEAIPAELNSAFLADLAFERALSTALGLAGRHGLDSSCQPAGGGAMSPTETDGDLEGAQDDEHERWFGSLSRALVPYSAGEHGTPLHRRVAGLLSPVAAKAVAGAFAEAQAEAELISRHFRPGAEARNAALHMPARRSRHTFGATGGIGSLRPRRGVPRQRQPAPGPVRPPQPSWPSLGRQPPSTERPTNKRTAARSH